MQPARLPTRLVLYGRNVDLLPTVSLRIANFPQQLTPSDVAIVFGASAPVEATVLSVEDTARCLSGETSNCNRYHFICTSFVATGTISSARLLYVLKNASVLQDMLGHFPTHVVTTS
jgi:hypothetical protein